MDMSPTACDATPCASVFCACGRGMCEKLERPWLRLSFCSERVEGGRCRAGTAGAPQPRKRTCRGSSVGRIGQCMDVPMECQGLAGSICIAVGTRAVVEAPPQTISPGVGCARNVDNLSAGAAFRLDGRAVKPEAVSSRLARRYTLYAVPEHKGSTSYEGCL